MRNIVAIVLISLSASSVGQSKYAGDLTGTGGDLGLRMMSASQIVAQKEACVDPYRKLGTNYITLKPMFDWRHRESGTNPMPQWEHINTQVSNVSGLKILVRFQRDVAWITNYPKLSSVVDGSTINAYVKRVGIEKYLTVTGLEKTVPLLDYGIPFNPWSKTNNPPTRKP